MDMPGLDGLKAHLPDLNSAFFRLHMGLIGIISFAAATAFMIAVDHVFPTWTLVGQGAVFGIAFMFLSRFFVKKTTLKARFGDRAYRHAFRAYIIPGMPMILAGITHNAYLPGERILSGFTATVVYLVAAYLLITGIIMWVRAVLTFGVDNLTMVYVYFPEESRMVDSSIYSLIRHPVYSAVLRIAIAIGLWHGTWFSIVFSLLMPLGMMIWLKLVEEPELIGRFGDDYAAYSRMVPAFSPRLRNIGKFWRFLITGN